MKSTVTLGTLIASFVCELLVGSSSAHAAQAQSDSDSASKTNDTRPHGISKRVPWTTSRIIGTPEPPSPYQMQRVFPNLKFNNPVDLVNAPGTDRLFLMEQAGRIYSFRPMSTVEKPDDFLNLTNIINGVTAAYGLAFHPGFESNRYVYVCYVLKEGLPEGSRVSRFTVSKSDPPVVDPASENLLITWLSGGHNGGCLKFGPDGYFYISTGDGVGPNPPDTLKTGQDNSDLLSSILRIDVDREANGKPYRIPDDNPFATLEGTRPEIWAYGFRNPWKMSFDRKSGDLWTGDIGWELWELVFRVQRGGNYGWSIVEGPQSIHPDWKRGPTPILPAVKAHPHSEAASVTGGYVYRGTRFKDLIGAYVYGDWVTGKIWALRSEGNTLTSLRELVDTAVQIVGFGEDNAGELYVLDYAGLIHQLAPNPAANTRVGFPRQLSETGLFASVKDQLPSPGVLPFFINAEMWADHAVAERFVGLPGASLIQTGAKDVWIYQSKNEWRYPTNAVLAKTLSLDMKRGDSKSRRRVETQVLHYDGLDWHAYSYRWNDQQTDATLVGAEGEDPTFEIEDWSAPGKRLKQSWRFHARAECLRCHNPWVNYALAFTAPQLNREGGYWEGYPLDLNQQDRYLKRFQASTNAIVIVPDNQLRAFSHVGFFDQPLDERARPSFTNPYLHYVRVPADLSGEARSNLTERARSWLHVNCAHCHREGAGGSVVSHFDYETKLAAMKSIGRIPSQGNFGLAGAHVITPGDPYRSVLYYRILTTGQGHMPLIGPRLVDGAGANLIHDWIAQLPKELSEDKSEYPDAEKLGVANAGALKRIWGSQWSKQQRRDAWDRLLSSTGGALAVLTEFNRRYGPIFPSPVPEWKEELANHSAFQVRDLFDRYLPEYLRPKKLGASFDVTSVLKLKGNAAHGKKVFSQEGGLQCIRCHRLEGEGVELGPDLSHVGQKYDRAQLLDHLLNPSKTIDPAYVSYQAETKGELMFSGFLVRKTPAQIVLKDANNQEIRLAADDVKTLKTQAVSTMPELLLQNSTAQEAADLIEFLFSLK